jgi:hypothetical protein
MVFTRSCTIRSTSGDASIASSRAPPASRRSPPARAAHTRQRLDQGGNRQINAALHRVIVTRARCHQPTRDDLERRRREGKSTREAIRCLKRYLTRAVWRLLQPPRPATDTLPPSIP